MSQPTSFVLAPNLLSPSAPLAPDAPQTKSALPPPNFLADAAFPQARWSLGGALLYDSALVEFLKFLRTEVPVVAVRDVSGAPPCAWTLDWYSTRPLVPPGTFSERVKKFSELGVGFSLDFDNPHVGADALEDVIGNTLLRSCATLSTMRVRIASEALADRIRAAFPQAKLHAGANLAVAADARGNADFYRRAAEKFETVTLHPLDAADSDFLEKLLADVPADRLEIEINDTCLRACPVRKEHLDTLAKMRLAPWDASLLQRRHALLAQASCENVCADPGNAAARAALLTRDERLRAYALGIRNFRIQAEKLRSELAFFWELGSLMLTDAPEFWHKKAAFMASSVNNVNAPVPVFKSGTSAFVMRKYE